MLEFCNMGTLKHYIIENYQKKNLKVPIDFIWNTIIYLANGLENLHIVIYKKNLLLK